MTARRRWPTAPAGRPACPAPGHNRCAPGARSWKAPIWRVCSSSWKTSATETTEYNRLSCGQRRCWLVMIVSQRTTKEQTPCSWTHTRTPRVNFFTNKKKQVALLLQGDRAAGWVSFSQKWRLELQDNIYGHYRSIFNHCDVIGQQNYRIR